MTPQEVQYLLAAPNSIAGYTFPGTVYNSLGNYCSTTQVNTSVAQNNLFPDITGPENAALQVDYQCVFIYNSDATSTMSNTYVWIPTTSVTSAAINWAIAADPTGVTNYNTVVQQALLIANPTTAPAGINTWINPSTAYNTGLSIGSIGPKQVFPVWVRRTATGVGAAPAAFNFQVTFSA